MIHIIVGATKEWATSSSKRKGHAQSIMSINAYKRPKIRNWQVEFSDLNIDLQPKNGSESIVVKAMVEGSINADCTDL